MIFVYLFGASTLAAVAVITIYSLQLVKEWDQAAPKQRVAYDIPSRLATRSARMASTESNPAY